MTLKWRVLGDDGPFNYDAIPGMDPAANWLLGPGRTAFLPEIHVDPVIPVLKSFTLSDTLSIPPELKRLFRSFLTSGSSPMLIRESFLKKLLSYGPGTPEFEFLQETAFSIKISTPYLGQQIIEKSFPDLPHPPADPPGGGWPDGTVVMAVIDDGLCFAHEAFRDSTNKTRIHYWWRQDGEQPNAEPTVPFGQEIGKKPFVLSTGQQRVGIDDLLAGTNGDEAAIYRSSGLIDFSKSSRSTAALRRSHGTHVLDVVAGYDQKSSGNIKRPIIAVQLPAEVVEQSSGAELEYHVVTALEYILHRARELKPDGEKLPVVISMSYGFIAGPHDGTTPLEMAIDERLEKYGDDKAQMVLSAGNSQLSRCHSEFSFAATGESVELEWMVLPDDRTSSMLEIWLPYDPNVKPPKDGTPLVDDRVEVSVVTPDGITSPKLKARQGHAIRLTRNGSVADIDTAAEVKYAFVAGETMRGMFRATLAPTEHLPAEPGPWAGHALAKPGVWRVRVHQKELKLGEPVNIWIQRDDTIYGFPPRGRQSYFVNQCYERFDIYGRRIVEDANADQACPVRRRGLVSAVATGEKVIVAGAYKRRERDIVNYSSGEPITPKQNQIPQPPAVHRKPDALMIAEDSRVHRGILAAGTCSGSVTRMGGTSVAAPGIARWLAQRADLGARPGRDIVKDGAEADESLGGPFDGAPALSQERGGWGRIESASRRIRVKRYMDC